jgi:hypothetical protein
MRSTRLLAVATAAIVLSACTSVEPGWTYAPAPSKTPPPSTEPSASGEPTTPPAGGGIMITAYNIAFDQTELAAPAEQAFQIDVQNDDDGVPHNLEIKDGGTSLFTGEIFNGVDKRTYDVPAIPAGSYQFLCTVHPNMNGTLTAS